MPSSQRRPTFLIWQVATTAMAICDGVARGAQGSNVDRGLKDVDFRKSKTHKSPKQKNPSAHQSYKHRGKGKGTKGLGKHKGKAKGHAKGGN